MDKIGLSSSEKADLFRVVAAVLHLGNITFEENHKDKKGQIKKNFSLDSFTVFYMCVFPGGSVVSGSAQVRQSLAGVANLLGLEVVELQRALTSRVMTTTKGGAVGTIIK